MSQRYAEALALRAATAFDPSSGTRLGVKDRLIAEAALQREHDQQQHAAALAAASAQLAAASDTITGSAASSPAPKPPWTANATSSTRPSLSCTA